MTAAQASGAGTAAAIVTATKRRHDHTLAVALFAFALSQLGASVYIQSTFNEYGDLGVLYASSVAFLHGQDAYWSENTTTRLGSRNLNPPHAIAVMAPMGWLSIRGAAYALWAAMALAMVITFAAVRRAMDQRRSVLVMAIFAASAASMSALLLFNLGWFLAAGAAWAFIWARNGDARKSGIAIGCLASVKIFFLLFGPYWLWRRNWRALAWASTAFIAIFLVGVAVLGTDVYGGWIRALREGTPLLTLRKRPLDASLLGIADRFGLPAAIPIVAMGLVLVVAWWRLRRVTDVDREWAIVLTAMLIVTPLGWAYYWLIPALPVALVLTTPTWGQRAAIVGMLVPPLAIAFAGVETPPAVQPIALSTYALAALGIFYGVVR